MAHVREAVAHSGTGLETQAVEALSRLEFQEAERALRQAVTDSDTAVLRLQLGRCLLFQGRMEDAILQFALAWEEAKGREDVCGRCESCLALAGAFRQQGNTHRAALYQQLALAAGSDAVAEGFPQEFRLIQALLLRECGQSAAAEEQLSALIAASQDGDLQGQASRLLAELRLEHSDLTAAMRLLAAGARQFLSAGNAHASGEALERLAELLLRARRWRRAVRSLRAAEWLARRCGQKELAGRRRGLRVRLQRSLAILAGEPERN